MKLPKMLLGAAMALAIGGQAMACAPVCKPNPSNCGPHKPEVSDCGGGHGGYGGGPKVTVIVIIIKIIFGGCS